MHAMKYTVSIEIALPRERVVQLGKQKIECTETITRREPADLNEIPRDGVVHFDREIAGESMWNAVRDRLTEAGPETTLWESESEYRFSGLLMRLVSRVINSLTLGTLGYAITCTGTERCGSRCVGVVDEVAHAIGWPC